MAKMGGAYKKARMAAEAKKEGESVKQEKAEYGRPGGDRGSDDRRKASSAYRAARGK